MTGPLPHPMLIDMGVGATLVRGPRLAMAAALICAACSGATTTAASRETDMADFVLTSSSFAEGGAIPVDLTCDGRDLSPALSWTGAPSGTQSFALILDDPDARGFVHWVIFDIPGGSSGSLPEGVDPADLPAQGRTDFGRTGYGGPCPPSGTHRYVFTLWALSATLHLKSTPSAPDLRAAIEGKVLAETTLTATYTRKR